MKLKLYFNPVSSYSQKVLLALYEKSIDFEREIVDLMDPAARSAYAAIYPLQKIPVLTDDQDHFIPESSIIIEYLDQHTDKGAKLLPIDTDLARRTRCLDRMIDQYLNDAVTTLLFQSWEPEARRDRARCERANQQVVSMYDHLERILEPGGWALGEEFSLADCAAAPALFYAQTVAPFGSRPAISRYWNQLSSRDSWQRIENEAAPYLADLPGQVQRTPTESAI